MNSDEHPMPRASAIAVPAGGAVRGIHKDRNGQWYARIDVPVRAGDRIAQAGAKAAGITVAAAPLTQVAPITSWPPSRLKRCRFAVPQPPPRALSTPARVALLEQLDRIRILHNAIQQARG